MTRSYNFDSHIDLKNHFLDPTGSNMEEAKSILNRFFDLLSESLFIFNSDQLANNTKFKLTLGAEGSELDFILKETKILLTNSINTYSPTNIAHMDSMPIWWSVIGDFLSSFVNNNLLSNELSPALTSLEKNIIEWFCNLFGFGEKSGGIMPSGGTLSNIQAIIVAKTMSVGIMEDKAVLFLSEDAHVSFDKLAVIGTLRSNCIERIPVDSKGSMDVSILESRIKAAKKRGKIPFAVVATMGTTVTGVLDPLQAIYKICKKEHLWLHVDAVYGGAIILSAVHKNKLDAINLADSISFNPQKWLHISKVCSILLFKEFQHLKKTFSNKSNYMKSGVDYNLGDVSLQGTKHADVFKLYLSIKAFGIKNFAILIDKSCAYALALYRNLVKMPKIEVLNCPELNIVCFRCKDATLTEKLFYKILEKDFLVSLPTYHGEPWIRVVILNPYIDFKIISHFENIINEFLKQDARYD